MLVGRSFEMCKREGVGPLLEQEQTLIGLSESPTLFAGPHVV